MLRLIRELADDDRVVVVATHDSRMLPLADQVIELVPHLDRLDQPPEAKQVAADEIVFRQNTMGELIYVVVDGEFEIVRELADGNEELMGVLR